MRTRSLLLGTVLAITAATPLLTASASPRPLAGTQLGVGHFTLGAHQLDLRVTRVNEQPTQTMTLDGKAVTLTCLGVTQPDFGQKNTFPSELDFAGTTATGQHLHLSLIPGVNPVATLSTRTGTGFCQTQAPRTASTGLVLLRTFSRD